MRLARSIGFMLTALAVLPGGAAPAAYAQTAKGAPANDLGAFVGRWQLNPAQTSMARFGPNGQNMTRAPTFTFIFEPAGSGLKINVYEHYPQDAPTRVTDMIPDRKPHGCTSPSACQTTGGNPADQSFTYFEIDPHMLVRLFYTKGQLTEYSTYAVSPDGRKFTLMSWSVETPEYQNIQVFDRQP
jgi:hypothetical protein